MMKKKLNTLMVWGLSFIGALVGVLIGSVIGLALARLGTILTLIANALFFLFVFSGGYLGMRLGLKIQHISVDLPKKHTRILVVCAVLIVIVSAGGQWLFMLNAEEDTIRTGGDTVDVVLLLDGSSSMDRKGYQSARNTAAAEFIESLDENTKLQVIGYNWGVISGCSSDLLLLTDENKETLVTLVSSMDTAGTTNYNAALEAALTTLAGSDAREDSIKAVILLTDGSSGDLLNSTISDFEDAGAMLFTVRLTGAGSSNEIQDLVELAESSGGFDLTLSPDASGDISSADLLSAFSDAFEQASESVGKKLTFSGSIMIYDAYEEDLSVWQFMIRFVTILLCMISASLAYYGETDRRSVILNMAAALLLNVVLFAAEDDFLIIQILLTALLLGTALPHLDLTEIPEAETGGDGTSGSDRDAHCVQQEEETEEDTFYV